MHFHDTQQKKPGLRQMLLRRLRCRCCLLKMGWVRVRWARSKCSWDADQLLWPVCCCCDDVCVLLFPIAANQQHVCPDAREEEKKHGALVHDNGVVSSVSPCWSIAAFETLAHDSIPTARALLDGWATVVGALAPNRSHPGAGELLGDSFLFSQDRPRVDQCTSPSSPLSIIHGGAWVCVNLIVADTRVRKGGEPQTDRAR